VVSDQDIDAFLRDWAEEYIWPVEEFLEDREQKYLTERRSIELAQLAQMKGFSNELAEKVKSYGSVLQYVKDLFWRANFNARSNWASRESMHQGSLYTTHRHRIRGSSFKMPATYVVRDANGARRVMKILAIIFAVAALVCGLPAAHYWYRSSIVEIRLESDFEPVVEELRNRVWFSAAMKLRANPLGSTGSQRSGPLTPWFLAPLPALRKLDWLNWSSPNAPTSDTIAADTYRTTFLPLSDLPQMWEKPRKVNEVPSVSGWSVPFGRSSRHFWAEFDTVKEMALRSVVD
jgi:hypothetical protein